MRRLLAFLNSRHLCIFRILSQQLSPTALFLLYQPHGLYRDNLCILRPASRHYGNNPHKRMLRALAVSCSERMPVIGELNWRTSFPLLVTCEIGVIPAYYGFVSVNGDRHYGFMESLKYGDDNGNHPQTNEYGLISNVTHWMPLPEPPL